MASATEAENFQELPCTYKDKTRVEREFDREYGWYNEYDPEHEYTIRVQGKTAYKEYVFTFTKVLDKTNPTLNELLTKTNNTYDLYEYNNDRNDLRNFKRFTNRNITSEGSEIEMGSGDPQYDYDYPWVRHGICKDYMFMQDNLRTFKYGETYGWDIQKEYKYEGDCKERILDQIIERLFTDEILEFGARNCLGYRIKKDGVLIENTISPEDFTKYGEVPSF